MKKKLLLSSCWMLSSLFGFIYPNWEFYQEGMRHFTNKNYSQAIDHFKKSLETDSKNSKILNALANSYQKNADFEQASKYYEQAISHLPARDSRREKIYFNQGNNFFRMEKFNLAIEQYKNALDLDDQDEATKKNLEIAIKKLQQQNQRNTSKEQEKNQNSQQRKNKKDSPKKENSPKSGPQDKQEPSDQPSQNPKRKKGDKSSSPKEPETDENKNSKTGSESGISLRRAEEIIKTFSEKELRVKGFQFYKQEKRNNKKNNKNW